MRGAIVTLVFAAPAVAAACPACAGATGAGLSPLLLVLVGLPFVVGGLAVRAIVRAMRE